MPSRSVSIPRPTLVAVHLRRSIFGLDRARSSRIRGSDSTTNPVAVYLCHRPLADLQRPRDLPLADPSLVHASDSMDVGHFEQLLSSPAVGSPSQRRRGCTARCEVPSSLPRPRPGWPTFRRSRGPLLEYHEQLPGRADMAASRAIAETALAPGTAAREEAATARPEAGVRHAIILTLAVLRPAARWPSRRRSARDHRKGSSAWTARASPPSAFAEPLPNPGSSPRPAPCRKDYPSTSAPGATASTPPARQRCSMHTSCPDGVASPKRRPSAG